MIILICYRWFSRLYFSIIIFESIFRWPTSRIQKGFINSLSFPFQFTSSHNNIVIYLRDSDGYPLRANYHSRMRCSSNEMNEKKTKKLRFSCRRILLFTVYIQGDQISEIFFVAQNFDRYDLPWRRRPHRINNIDVLLFVYRLRLDRDRSPPVFGRSRVIIINNAYSSLRTGGVDFRQRILTFVFFFLFNFILFYFFDRFCFYFNGSHVFFSFLTCYVTIFIYLFIYTYDVQFTIIIMITVIIC